MKKQFQNKWRKILLYFTVLFVVLFLFRLAYGYTKTFNNNTNQSHFFESMSNSKRNYATKKYKVTSQSNAQASIKVDQKYEKIASIKTKSSNFEKEETTSRKTIKSLNAIIQFEQKSGNKGFRNLNLMIGVPPENFDQLYTSLIAIGNVQAKQITKKDKTNEYKELNAKKQSLEKIRTSLMELKSKGGKIEEYMELENRILEIEQQLQGLGVSLGDFDDENEFCTVQFSLLEGKEIKIGILQRIKVALEWTVKIYLRLMTILFLASFFTYLLLVIIDKIKLFERMLNPRE